jgi:hypothetical protein
MTNGTPLHEAASAFILALESSSKQDVISARELCRAKLNGGLIPASEKPVLRDIDRLLTNEIKRY